MAEEGKTGRQNVIVRDERGGRTIQFFTMLPTRYFAFANRSEQREASYCICLPAARGAKVCPRYYKLYRKSDERKHRTCLSAITLHVSWDKKKKPVKNRCTRNIRFGARVPKNRVLCTSRIGRPFSR